MFILYTSDLAEVRVPLEHKSLIVILAQVERTRFNSCTPDGWCFGRNTGACVKNLF